MLEFLIILGQTASALLLLYGAILVLAPRRGTPAKAAEEHPLLVLQHLQNDA